MDGWRNCGQVELSACAVRVCAGDDGKDFLVTHIACGRFETMHLFD